MKKVIYPGTFDPITYGHIDLIKKALNIFDNLIIAISDGNNKEYLFSVEERETLIKKSLFKYLVISISFLIWMTFLDTNSLLMHAELNREIKKLKKKRDALNKEILDDKSLIEKLNDIDSLEHYAREEYNLKKENEDIFIIEFQSENE